MKSEELRKEIDIELELLESTLKELAALRNDVDEREPTVREKTAAGAFLAQFYGGIENILKRVCRFHGIPIPVGDTWHIDLFKRFCKPGYSRLPVLFDESLASDMAAFRKFRHVIYHGYGFQLDWARMKEGVWAIDNVYLRFKTRLLKYMQTL
ncbi:MAG: hypothetical protein HY026_01300 [Deltaproteobacteria bacterium]|nr:hypothetical protein [Deltaproteobacteria bacterium]